MTKAHITYEGDLHCKLEHESGSVIYTDAPKDNNGRGEHFSPTDLVGASLTSCILTTMAIYAKIHNKPTLGKMTAQVIKEMSTDAPRRIVKLTVSIQMPSGLSAEDRLVYERVAKTCPVHKSLHPDLKIDVSFSYLD